MKIAVVASYSAVPLRLTVMPCGRGGILGGQVWVGRTWGTGLGGWVEIRDSSRHGIPAGWHCKLLGVGRRYRGTL